MTHPRRGLRLLFAAGAVLVLGAPVQALSPIVYVSAGGSDANACTFAAPCRLLQRAVNLVQSRGVVQVLNSAAYGNVTIAKSLTISGGGNVVATGTRIYINSASAVVVLRGLVMDGRGTAATGIYISAAAAVYIEDCAIERYTQRGIQLDIDNTELFVADTVSRDNGVDGLAIFGAGAPARLTVDNSRFENNGQYGLQIIGAVSTITRSVMSGNGIDGIRLSGESMTVIGTTATNNAGSGYAVTDGGAMMMESSVGNGNGGYGLYVMDAFSYALISTSVLMDNTNVSIRNDGGVQTRGNNTFSSSTGNALTPFPSQ